MKKHRYFQCDHMISSCTLWYIVYTKTIFWYNARAIANSLCTNSIGDALVNVPEAVKSRTINA